MNHEGAQNLHPFFSKPLRNNAPSEDAPTTVTPIDDPNDDPDYEHASTNAQPTKSRKKRARKTEAGNDKKNGTSAKSQASLEQFTRPSAAEQADQLEAGDIAGISLEEDPNQERRKRRKTDSPGPVDVSTPPIAALDWHQQLQVEANSSPVENTTSTLLDTVEEDPDPLLGSASIVPIAATAETMDTDNKLNPTPKKQIKVTKSGKLVSSPPKPTTEEPTTPKKRRGRKPAKAATIFPTVTVIKYGLDSASKHAIGGRIEAIMSGIRLTSKRPGTTNKRSIKATEPPKVTHPFFTGKPGQKLKDFSTKPTTDLRPPTPRKSAVTPGKLRAETRRDRSPDLMPAFGMTLGSSRAPKQSGLLEALADEDVISRLAKDLAPDMHIATRGAILDFTPPEDVRLPSRLLTTGIEIQQKVKKHLQTHASRSGDSLHDNPGLHPAVASLFNEIEHTLTPFDEGRCEGQAWTQKYAPKCVSQVLQEGKEATVLKDWLQSLTVLAVGGGLGSSKVEPSDSKKPPRKKRKKAVDDFIVSSDEEEDEEMIELSSTQLPLHAKSFRRPRWTRNNNVVLISGPHGCGKSAAVYAVAKELDFEVFEINSSTRRSGKDIQDKVGDMTANHLVNHKRPEAPSKEEITPADDTDNERSDAALQQDIDSGRQGTMMSFFKSTPTTKPKPKVQSKLRETKQPPVVSTQAMLPQMTASRKSQKQSLILFEEADILFEEDQQFWAQVTKLAAQSKRPIIITCNDERQIPMRDLPLAAILRLRPSAVDLAADYMLVLAGREGHVLERQAVDDLYRSKSYDLRASITELDLWCQMSVGDRKGGLEWMYQRWPPGKDIDAEGRFLRVASKGTYQSGMGYLSHNIFETRSNAAFDKEEELLTEVWSDWGINPSDWEAQPLWSEPTSSDQTNNLAKLDAFTEALSAADVYCRVGLPSYQSKQNEPIDPTSSLVTDKARLNYTLAAPLVEADQQFDFLQFDTAMYIQTHLLAHRAFSALSNVETSHNCRPMPTEGDYTRTILRAREMRSKDDTLSRPDFAVALDVLAALPDQTLPERTSFILTPSSFDRTFSIITLDLAPYVRSIVAHEQILEGQRIRMSSLLSGGGTGKRARTTRASRVALEGGVRETKRRDRWFGNGLNFELVMATAGKDWTGMGWRSDEDEVGEGTGSATGTQDSLPGSQDIIMHGAEDE
ncbi:hypothetical protein CC86DRAFT_324824 [Ophiobolus disseminans]|uniref:AAA+ ATPase domain-containing protein n=1 Tax=Ophiobolus disseminans TaxID=1469910 RepID=A0A6A6ZZC0_9PLEO|nr:hypothetical protein CC86DRAFT_324824 [Ophiobolus disseminans]